MATTEYRKIQLRRDTAAALALVTPASGEPVWSTDTKGLAIGDGSTLGGNKLNPMTAVGDVIVGGTAGAAARLAIGSTGQLFTVTAGTPAWSSTVAAAITFSSGTASTSTTTGSVIVTGGLGVSGAANVGSNLIVGTGSATVFMAVDRGTTAQNNFYRWRTATSDNWAVGSGATSTNTDLEFYSYGIPGRAFVVAYSTGNVTMDRALTVTGFAAFNAATTTASGSIFVSSTDPAIRLKTTGSVVADLNTFEIRNLGATANTYLQFRTVNDANSVFTTRMALWQDGGLYLGTNPGAVGSPGSGCLLLTGTTASTSTTTGTLIVTGGVGIGGALYASGTIGIGSTFSLVPVSSNNLTMTSSGSDVIVNLNAGGTNVALFGVSGGNTFIDYSGILNFRSGFGGTTRLTVTAVGDLTVSTGSIATAAPSGGTAGAWKLGIRVAAAVVLDATQYAQVDIGGTLYKFAMAV